MKKLSCTERLDEYEDFSAVSRCKEKRDCQNYFPVGVTYGRIGSHCFKRLTDAFIKQGKRKRFLFLEML